jgi:hypothetical protein
MAREVRGVKRRAASKSPDRTSICAGNSLNIGAGSRRPPFRAVNGPWPAERADRSADILGRPRIR